MKRPFLVPMLILAALVCSVASDAAVTTAYPETIPLFSHVSFDGKSSEPGKCSGTFIHPRLLLTAAHCVRHFNALKIGNVITRATDMSGNPVPDLTAKPGEVYILRKKWWGMKKVHPVRVHVSSLAVPVNRGNLTLEHVEEDLAILEFDFDAGAGRTREISGNPPHPGDRVEMVGFGSHGKKTGGGAGFGNTMPVKHFGRNTVYELEYDTIVVEGSAEVCTNPEKQTDDWALCGGDSGGPLIDSDTGRILGVASASAVVRHSLTGPERKHSYFADLNSPGARAFVSEVLRSVESK